MAQQKPMLLDQDYFSDSTNMRPWLDGMIGRANEVLNALLRLRKHQMAAEIMKLHGGQDQADSHSVRLAPPNLLSVAPFYRVGGGNT